MGRDTSWRGSADAWIAYIDSGDPVRELLLDGVMLRLVGEVTGRRVLDLGCGEGRFCRMLGKRGAATVGIDPTAGMVVAAAARHPVGSYVRAPAETLPFADAIFDLAVSYITLVDIQGYREAIREVARVLRPGGRFVVANVGFTSASGGWKKDSEGRRLYRPVDRYLEERPIPLELRGIRVINWHRPLSGYMQAYLGAGLLLRDFLEPMPPDDSLRADPFFEDWYRVPEFTVMVWERPA